MASLYDIDERLKALEEFMVDSETGELIEDEERFNELYDNITMDLSEKIENTMCFYKNLLSDAKQIGEEEKMLKMRRKAKEKLAQRLKDRINRYICSKYTDEEGNLQVEDMNGFKFETPRVRLSYRRSEVVNVLNLDTLDKNYLKVKTTVEPNKSMIKEAIKKGKTVEGAELQVNLNMQVK